MTPTILVADASPLITLALADQLDLLLLPNWPSRGRNVDGQRRAPVDPDVAVALNERLDRLYGPRK